MELLILCIDLLSMGGLDFWNISVQLFAKGKQTVGFFWRIKAEHQWSLAGERKCEKGYNVSLFLFPLLCTNRTWHGPERRRRKRRRMHIFQSCQNRSQSSPKTERMDFAKKKSVQKIQYLLCSSLL